MTTPQEESEWWYMGSRESQVSVIISPWLYMGGSGGRKFLEELHIQEVISITSDWESLLSPLPESMRQHPPFSLPDSATVNPALVVAMLDQTREWLHAAQKANTPIFVHCAAGISRSATVIMDYLMSQDEKLGYEDALLKLRESRGCVRPNGHFKRILMERYPGRKHEWAIAASGLFDGKD
jgi:predicted protein tyrosine phosphatase